MKKNKLLYYVTTHILDCLGLVFPPLFGVVGISHKDFKTDHKVKYSENDNIKEVNIYAGYCLLDNNCKIKIISCIIKNDTDSEIIAIFKVDSGELIHSLYKNNNDITSFLLYKDEKFNEISLSDALLKCSSFEELTNNGILWIPDKDLDKQMINVLYKTINSQSY